LSGTTKCALPDFKHILSTAYLRKPVYSASLAVFRVVFGLMILGSMIRFGAKGWIDELYIQPGFFFKYYGFEWVRPLGNYTYWLFIICGISALLFALGLFYRVAAICLFLSFTYIELMDKTNYLNHYYFVSLVLFLMIWLPANANFAWDNIRKPQSAFRLLPLWTTGVLRLLLGIVYCYAGLAKLNSDWLLDAMPLRLWLPAKNDLFLVGPLFNKLWVAYFFSWFGALYDLTIPFFLLYRRTRMWAYLVVILFHITTALLFPIGMFPYVMILATLVFFPSKEMDSFLLRLQWNRLLPAARHFRTYRLGSLQRKAMAVLLSVFLGVQIIVPWRYLCIPGELFWTEEGYRFSWRVMLIEKMGYAQFIVKDGATGRKIGVNNNDFLTKNQEKMMSTQADFILQYAHFLHDYYRQRGFKEPRVYATVFVTLNGRRSKLYIDPDTDLAKEKDTFKHKKWILPFKDKIHGF
jgi:hypothetical protein